LAEQFGLENFNRNIKMLKIAMLLAHGAALEFDLEEKSEEIWF